MRRLMFVLMCLCLASPLLAVNLLVNPDLETGTTDGWGARFGGGNIEIITTNPEPHGGTYALRDYNRAQTWHGVVQTQNMFNVADKGVAYPSSVWVRTNTVSPVNVACTMQYNPSSGALYNQIANADVSNAAWVELANPAYLVIDNDATTATWYVEVPGSATAELYVDDAMFGFDDQASGLPYDPIVTPENPDGTVGNIVNIGTVLAPIWQVHDVVLGFKAGIDPNEILPMNPAIVKHNIYLQTGAPDDPNLYFYDSVAQPAVDENTDPNISYGPLPDNLLVQGTTYEWQVEEVLLDPNGVEYPDGNPNNILGSVWSFKASSATPNIVTSPAHTLTDANGDATLEIATGLVANNYRWYKVVGVQDTEGGESDDVMLTDTGIYSGTQTKILTITGAAADGSDDAQVYAIAYNGIPGAGGTPSLPSATAWFWYPRLVNHYAFEDMDTAVDANGVTTDDVSGYNMRMASNDTGGDVPVLDGNIPTAPGIAGNTSSLLLNNPRANPADPNNGDAQYAVIDGDWVAGYKDITISMWVYSNGGSNWNRMIDIGNDTNNYVFVCTNPGSVNRAVRFAVKLNGTEQTVTTPAETLPNNEWTYISATLTGSTARVYINGELRATSTTMTNDPVSFGPAVNRWLGRSQWGAGDGYFNGLIDELKIYNYALTTIEVGQDYLADTLEEYVCNLQIYDLQDYDTNENCLLDLPDFASFAVRWLEDDRIYPAP